jgi:hypothetical protein
MSEGYSKSIEMLKKFSGKTKDIELTDDDGNVQKIKMYPLPNRYMAEMIEVQKFSQVLPKKEVDGKEVIDQEKCTSEQRTKLFEMNRKIVALSLAHSLKKANGTMTESEFDSVKDLVDDLPAPVISQIIIEISGLNEVPLGQEGVEKK